MNRYRTQRQEILNKKKCYDTKYKELVNEQYREWYRRNKEKKIEQKKKYYLEHKDKYKEYNKKYREKLKEELNGYDLSRRMKGWYHHLEKHPYLKWRKDSCELCGFDVDKRVLDVHHLDSTLKNTKDDNKDNTLTLCKNCHILTHMLLREDWIKLMEKLKGGNLKLNKIKCSGCDLQFIPLITQQKFCSKKCYAKYRLRKKEFDLNIVNDKNIKAFTEIGKE